MITLFLIIFCYNYNKTEVNFHEKFQKSIIVFVTLFSMLDLYPFLLFLQIIQSLPQIQIFQLQLIILIPVK